MIAFERIGAGGTERIWLKKDWITAIYASGFYRDIPSTMIEYGAGVQVIEVWGGAEDIAQKIGCQHAGLDGLLHDTMTATPEMIQDMVKRREAKL